MTILSLILTIAILGFGCWAVLQIPMPVIFQRLIIGVITICVVIWVIQQFSAAVPAVR